MKKQTISDADQKRFQRLRSAEEKLNNTVHYGFGYKKNPLGVVGEQLKRDIAELKHWRNQHQWK